MKKKQKPRPIRVMLVDDHAGLRRALRAIIDSQPDLEVVAEADGGLSALQLYQRATPDIVLMDGSMPDMSGVEATHRLKQLQPEARIIGLSLYDESTYREEMLTAGASGYVLKTGSTENVLNAIRSVYHGGTYFDRAISRATAPVVQQASSTENLTKEELAVAKLLADGKTNQEIAELLNLEIKTVETLRAAAMKKLDVVTRAGLLRVAAKLHWFEDSP